MKVKRNIVALLDSGKCLSAVSVAQELQLSLNSVQTTLSLMAKGNEVDRVVEKKTTGTKGRQNVYLYRKRDANQEIGSGVVLGQQGAVPNQAESIASS
jgi:predicted transcriptional regulator